MCTVVVSIAPGEAWPVVLAANRDERVDRAWDAPGAYWPGILAGRDRLGGGTWLGVNARGVAAAVLNRPGSLGPAPGKRSRGELPLLALGADDAAGAVARIGALDAGAYRSFNMVVADRRGAWFLRGLERATPEAVRLSDGVHMVTAHDPDDLASARVARHWPRFRAARRPSDGDWGDWVAVLRDASGPAGSELCVPERGGFGTVCSSLVALPAVGGPVFLFAAGRPDGTAFEPVGTGLAEPAAP